MPYSNPMDLAALDPDSGLVRVVIDTPRGSRNKYKYDTDLGLFKLSRILPAGMSFPHDFGSVPGTCAEDGDALDVLVLTEAPLLVGCLVNVRLIGVVRVRQKERRKFIRNDRLIGAVETTVNKAGLHDLDEMPAEQVRDLDHFFRSYNEAQGRLLEIVGHSGPKAARRILEGAIKSFESRQSDRGTRKKGEGS